MSGCSAITRSAQLRRYLRHLNLLHHRSYFTSPSSPLPHLSNFSSLSPINNYRELNSFRLCHRYLSTSAPTTSSGDGENSQGSQQSGGDAGKSIRGSPVSWVSLLLLLVTGAGVVFYYDREKKRHIEEIGTSANMVRQGPSVGQAAIGGPFKLINHEGKTVTDKNFLGKWTVMYFGFTHCPDICPDELLKLAAAVDKIKEKSGIEIIPVFISVDPERDTVEQVSEYVKEFHPKLIGLTGDPEEIRKVARAYRVYYMKTIEEGSDYLVDHSIVMYLMSPEMDFVKFYGKNNNMDELTDGIIKEVKQYKK